MTEDEMVGWHHRLNGHESEQAPGDGEEQGSVAFCMGSQRVRHDLATEKRLCMGPGVRHRDRQIKPACPTGDLICSVQRGMAVGDEGHRVCLR